MPSHAMYSAARAGGIEPVEPMSLDGLCRRLDAADGSPSQATIQAWLSQLAPTRADLEPYWVFDEDSYRRNVIRRTPTYEMLLLCWRFGQQSPIHDHGGSQCALLVLAGKATELRFERDPAGRLRPTSYQHLPTGALTASSDDDIHVLANWSDPPRDLVTLHVYSPPLDNMHTYPDSKVTPADRIRRLPMAPPQNLHLLARNPLATREGTR